MQSIQTSRIKHAKKNISLDIRTASELAPLGRFGNSYNDICQRLIAKEKMFKLTTANKEADV